MGLVEFALNPESPEREQSLLWLTDLHLNLAEPLLVERLHQKIVEIDADALLIGGDLSDGADFKQRLEDFLEAVQKPIYFVLGNHDCYDIGIAGAREIAQTLTEEYPEITYLSTKESPVLLTETFALVGQDGWSDGRAGNFLETPIQLNDFLRIPELSDISAEERFERVKALGDEAAERLAQQLQQAFSVRDEVIVLTHVPPFREASRYNDLEANDDWGPHFVCQAMGERLRELMADYPEKDVTLFCGHAHHGCDLQIGTNLRVITGDAKSGIPQIQGAIYL